MVRSSLRPLKRRTLFGYGEVASSQTSGLATNIRWPTPNPVTSLPSCWQSTMKSRSPFGCRAAALFVIFLVYTTMTMVQYSSALQRNFGIPPVVQEQAACPVTNTSCVVDTPSVSKRRFDCRQPSFCRVSPAWCDRYYFWIQRTPEGSLSNEIACRTKLRKSNFLEKKLVSL